MEIKQNPFSLYDFFGYLIPGITFIYGIIFTTYSNYDLHIFYSLITRDENIFISIPFIVISYIAGHLLSFVSSLTIEKYALWRYGYPSKFLLDENDPPIPPKYFTEKKFSINTLLKIVLPFILLPILVLDHISRKLLKRNYWNNRKLDSLSQQLIRAKSKSIYTSLSEGINVDFNKINFDGGVDWFTILHHYTFERSKAHNPKFQNYVALYGFLRCVSLLFVVFFWISIYTFILNEFTFNNICWLKTSILFLLPYLFFLSFLKFYKRYSLETLMAMTVLSSEK